MEEEEKNLWDARSGLRTGLGLGFEVGANTLLDVFSFEPTSQVAGGTFINYLAQKIRGGEISKGELAAAGLTSLIPGGSQARALTRGGRFTRSVAKGGLAGGITTTSMSLLDEKKLPSFGELAGGVGAGGTFGGMFDLAPATFTGKLGSEASEIAGDTTAFLGSLKHKVTTGKGIIPDMILEGGVMDIGAGGLGRSNPRPIREWRYRPPDADASYKINQKLFNDAVLENGNFSVKLYDDGKTNEAWRRKVGINYQTNPSTRVGWETTKRELRHNWEALYGSTMQRLNYETKDIQIEHIFTLQQSMPIYEGVRFGSPLYNEIQEHILKRGYDPGNTERNLMAILPHLHQQKTNYFNALHGKDGKRFFTQDIIDEMVKSKKFRFDMIDKYLDEVDKGKKILDDALEVFDTLNIEGQDYMPEELAERLGKLELTDYSAPELKALFAEFEAEGFRTNPKVSAKTEKAAIKAENQIKKADEAKEAQFDKSFTKTLKDVDSYTEWLESEQSKFKGRYDLRKGLRDDQLRTDAEDWYNYIERNSKIGQAQLELFDTSYFKNNREKVILQLMKDILKKAKRRPKRRRK